MQSTIAGSSWQMHGFFSSPKRTSACIRPAHHSTCHACEICSTKQVCGTESLDCVPQIQGSCLSRRHKDRHMRRGLSAAPHTRAPAALGKSHSMPLPRELLSTLLLGKAPSQWQGTCAPAAPRRCSACVCAAAPDSSGACRPQSQASAVCRMRSRRWQAGWLARWGPIRHRAQRSCRALRWVCSVMRSPRQRRPRWPCARSHPINCTCPPHQR